MIVAKYLRFVLKYILPLIALVGILGISGCSQTSPYPETMWTQNVYPGQNLTYDLGSPTYIWHNLYVENINGVLSGNVTGTGVPGRLVQWVGASIIANATNTDAQVAAAVANSHAQNTDIILTYNGVNALIDAGLLAYDLRTDRWAFLDTNTFLGVGVTGGAGVLAGARNTAYGNETLYNITTGSDNTALGWRAGYNITTGDHNTAVGDQTLQALSSGAGNTAVGELTLGSETTGIWNTAVGVDALWQNVGSYNTALGASAGGNNLAGSSNVFIGSQAGEDELGSNKLYIDNTDDATPLIYGDFSTDKVTINGDLTANGNFNYGTDAGANDTYTCTIIGVTAYVIGMPIYFNANTANTGACTLNINGLGAIDLKVKGNTTDPENNWIVADEIVHCVYDGAVFQIMNPDSTP
jgi:hypothetical protein